MEPPSFPCSILLDVLIFANQVDVQRYFTVILTWNILAYISTKNSEKLAMFATGIMTATD